MKLISLAVSTVAATALTAGMAFAQMQPIPNPPEHARSMHASHHRHAHQNGHHHGHSHSHSHAHHHHHHHAH